MSSCLSNGTNFSDFAKQFCAFLFPLYWGTGLGGGVFAGVPYGWRSVPKRSLGLRSGAVRSVSGFVLVYLAAPIMSPSGVQANF